MFSALTLFLFIVAIFGYFDWAGHFEKRKGRRKISINPIKMKNILQHPSAFIDAGDVHIIRAKRTRS